jgi:hypothetical protein
VVDLAKWALVTLGLVYLTTESAIFSPIRVLIARRGLLLSVLVYCASCTGFWVGLATSWLTWPSTAPWWARCIEGGIAAMALGAVWSAARNGNPMWDAETALRDPTTTIQEEA